MTLAAIAFAAAGMISCEKPSVDDPSGKYPQTKELTSLTLSSCETVKGESLRTFTLSFSGEENVVLTLVGSTYYLAADTYTIAEEAAAKKSNYIGSKTTIGGNAVISGSIIVTKDGDADKYALTDNYKLDAMLYTSDGTPYKLVWNGNLKFESDEEPTGPQTMTEVIGVSNYYEWFKSWYEVHLLGVIFSDGSVKAEYNSSTFSYAYSGSGPCLQLELYTADGKLAPGTYTASKDPKNVGEGEFGVGYTGDNGPSGSIWSKMVEGVHDSYEYITDGTVTVSLDDNVFTIVLTSSVVEATFSGEIDGLSDAGNDEPDPNPEMLKLSGLTLTKTVTPVYDSSYAEVSGIKSWNMTLSDANGTVANFALVVADGNEAIAGEYTVKSSAAESFTAEAGADWSWAGIGIIGSYYYKDGSLVMLNADEKFTVKANEDGSYTFTDDSAFELSGKEA